MVQCLSLATFAAADLDRSRAFYEAFGWTAGFHNDEVVFFQLSGVVLALYRRDAFAAELGVPASELAPGV